VYLDSETEAEMYHEECPMGFTRQPFKRQRKEKKKVKQRTQLGECEMEREENQQVNENSIQMHAMRSSTSLASIRETGPFTVK